MFMFFVDSKIVILGNVVLFRCLKGTGFLLKAHLYYKKKGAVTDFELLRY